MKLSRDNRKQIENSLIDMGFELSSAPNQPEWVERWYHTETNLSVDLMFTPDGNPPATVTCYVGHPEYLSNTQAVNDDFGPTLNRVSKIHESDGRSWLDIAQDYIDNQERFPQHASIN